jgi:putative Flp pilus-assembly TadE/G-like protein
MKKIHLSNQGQVLIIFVFAIVGLIAMTGLAVDGSNIYSDRRHAQNAADTASLAAAVVRNNWEKSNHASCDNFTTQVNPPATWLYPPPGCAGRIITAALDLAQTNGYSGLAQDNNRVAVYSPPLDGTYAVCGDPNFDCHDYIQVIINTDVDTYFAKVLGIRQLHNRVEAVALSQFEPEAPLYGGNALVQLATTSNGCGGDFVLGGSGTVTLIGGGIFVNSDNASCAFKETNNCVTLTFLPLHPGDPLPGIEGYGGQFNSGCANAPIMTHASPQYKFPPDHLITSTPSQCGTAGSYTTIGNGANGTTTYNQGSYGTFPVLNTKSVLNPGVYCVDKLQNNNDITGDGVLIYIRPGGSLDMNGGTVDLKAATSGDYAGYLIYGEWNSSSTVKTCTINGGSSDTYTGLIFVPYCNITVNGTSSPTGITAQIVAYQITLSGTSTLNFIYDASKLPKKPEKNFTGLYH